MPNKKQKKDKRDKPGQFTTEVHKTKVKAKAEGVRETEASLSQQVKEAEERLIEQGRQIGLKEAIDKYSQQVQDLKDSHQKELDELRINLRAAHSAELESLRAKHVLDKEEVRKEGWQEGHTLGLKASGDARYQQGIERGRSEAEKYTFPIAREEGMRMAGKENLAIGITIGGVVVFLALLVSQAGVATGAYIFGLIEKLVY